MGDCSNQETGVPLPCKHRAGTTRQASNDNDILFCHYHFTCYRVSNSRGDFGMSESLNCGTMGMNQETKKQVHYFGHTHTKSIKVAIPRTRKNNREVRRKYK